MELLLGPFHDHDVVRAAADSPPRYANALFDERFPDALPIDVAATSRPRNEKPCAEWTILVVSSLGVPTTAAQGSREL